MTEEQLNQITADPKTQPLYMLAEVCKTDWKKVYFGAVPYLKSMLTLASIDDNDWNDSGRSVVAYFLNNAKTWRGPVAVAIKAELKRRLK